MPEINLVQAVNLALAHAMAEDANVLVLGEDVAAEGGVFRATDGLLKRFGPDRVLDTPLAENAIAGLSVGLAAQGFRPVAEIQFTGFIYPAIDQLVNHASRLRTRTRGRLSCPMVVRSPAGGGIRATCRLVEALASRRSTGASAIRLSSLFSAANSRASRP